MIVKYSINSYDMIKTNAYGDTLFINNDLFHYPLWAPKKFALNPLDTSNTHYIATGVGGSSNVMLSVDYLQIGTYGGNRNDEGNYIQYTNEILILFIDWVRT